MERYKQQIFTPKASQFLLAKTPVHVVLAVTRIISRLAYTAGLWYFSLVQNPKKHEFTVIVERDESGCYLASVPELPGCHTQARSLDKLMDRVKEAIELCREVQSNSSGATEFIGVQRIAV